MVKNARRVITLLVIIFFYFSFTSANKLTAQEFYLGLKTGSGWSGFTYEGQAAHEIDTEQKLNIALTYNLKFSEKYGLNIETGYSDRGVQIDNNELDYRLNYLDMPILLDYYPVPRVRLNAGPEITYLISAINQQNDSTKVNIMDRFENRWAINGAIGANYSINFFLDAGIRYQIPITTISQSDATLNTRNTKSRYLQLYLLFKIAN